LRSFGQLRETLPTDLDRVGWAGGEVLINQLPGCLYGYDLAEKHGLRLYRAATIPLARTAAFPMLAFPRAFARVSGYNRQTYRLAEKIVWSGFGPSLDRWRRDSLGLPPWGGAGPFDRMEAARVPILCGMSPHVVLRPFDWGEHIHMTGYWFPLNKESAEDVRLLRFLEAGPAPVFLGFGSMPIRDPAATTRRILEAIRRSGQRAVLQAGWAGLGADALPEHVLGIGEADYGWLFPRMQAIVHHGGSGTTSFSLRAGVPAVIVPFAFDQFYWGRRLAELGVGPPSIPFRRLTARRLAQALEIATGDEDMRRRSGALAVKIRAEDGVGRAVEILERGTEQLSIPRSDSIG
jgi:UDP:flavonoid glycosyltransferase YjiC (YdhE family)